MATRKPGPRIPSSKSRKPPAAKIHTQNDIDRLWTDDRKTPSEPLKNERPKRRRCQKPKGLHIVWRGRVLHISGTYRGVQDAAQAKRSEASLRAYLPTYDMRSMTASTLHVWLSGRQSVDCRGCRKAVCRPRFRRPWRGFWRVRRS